MCSFSRVSRSPLVLYQPHTTVHMYLLIKINECLVGKFEGLDGLKHCVPVAMVDLSHKPFYAVHCVQSHTCLLLILCVCVCVHAAFQVLWDNSVMCAIVSYTSQKQKGRNLGYPNYILILIQWSVWGYKFFAARTRQDKARCQTNQHQEPSHLLMYQWHWPVRLVQWYLQLLSLDAKVLRNIYWYTALNGSGVH